jgi:hypothetical protein
MGEQKSFGHDRRIARDLAKRITDSTAMLVKSKQFQTQVESCKVTKEDLKRLGQVSELLTLLNDPYIGPYKLTACIEGLPVLAARCRREAALLRPRNEVEQIERALNVLGNRGVEKVLLELLEDMTILKSELDATSRKK